MKNLYLILIFFLIFSKEAKAQLNVTYISHLEYNETDLNDVWGYVAPDGMEYALLGRVWLLCKVGILMKYTERVFDPDL